MPRLLALCLFAATTPFAQDWKLPADRETMKRDQLAAILAHDDYPPTTAFSQRVDYIDFDSFGQQFT